MLLYSEERWIELYKISFRMSQYYAKTFFASDLFNLHTLYFLVALPVRSQFSPDLEELPEMVIDLEKFFTQLMGK